MSRENIVSITPTEVGVIVTFQTHTQGEISYLYDLIDGAQILAGADPLQFSGTRLG
jgi:hypothetical protein